MVLSGEEGHAAVVLWNQDEFMRAYLFAARAHKYQKVKGTTDLPYIVHFSLVTMEVLAALQVDDNLNGDLALQCALLHDVVEDAGVTVEALAFEFGERVSSGVQALSNTADRHLPCWYLPFRMPLTQ